MMKPKPKQPSKKSCTQNDPDFEECIQDGWVVVKKQKVTILIPSLPVTEQCTIPSIATKEVDHITPPQPDPPVTMPLATYVTTLSVTPQQPDPPVTMPLATYVTTLSVTHQQPDPPVTMPFATTKPNTTLSNPPKLNQMPKPRNRHNCEPNYHRTLGICSAPRARKCCGNLFNGHILANPKMRALNLERKLQRAGGLDSWLVSIGLGQFVKIFRHKRVGKVQLVNLTMKKLKDMGADAVGPRRKLMHAIDCLW